MSGQIKAEISGKKEEQLGEPTTKRPTTIAKELKSGNSGEPAVAETAEGYDETGQSGYQRKTAWRQATEQPTMAKEGKFSNQESPDSRAAK
jgi:hypothetical protein